MVGRRIITFAATLPLFSLSLEQTTGAGARAAPFGVSQQQK